MPASAHLPVPGVPSLLACCVLALAATPARCAFALAPEAVDNLLALSLEELGEVQVSTASRQGGSLADVPASVYVIHGDDLRLAGVRSLPEALRLAPNLQVARVDAGSYAISARGFKTTLSNKMLVLVDGREIYTPLFSGVLWDQQDTFIEDIERIEVVSGPGASLWGSNAVNGVISITTRSAADTLGGAALVFGGTQQRGAAVRQGMAVGANGNMRVYAKHRVADGHTGIDRAPVGDRWEQTQAGLRSDFQLASGAALRVQGDAFDAQSEPRAFGPIEASGHNLMAEWSRPLAAGGDLDIQAYYDVVERHDPLVLHDRMRIASTSFQHTLGAGAHRLVWGGGYRRAHDSSSAGFFSRLVPASRTLEWLHLFVEDEVSLSDAFKLDLGLRLESNSYTGVEALPSLRFSWKAHGNALVWGALSRAVRAPSRLDRDFFLPAQEPFLIRGGPGFESEVSNVAELGYRSRPSDTFYISLTAFHHWHDRLRSGQVAADGSATISNGISGRTYGIEGWATLRVPGAWELSAGVLEMRQRLRLDAGSNDPDGISQQGNDPEHQYLLRASRRFFREQQLSLTARRVGALPDPYVPSYASVDARWSWLPNPNVRLGVAVENLLDKHHAEFEPAALLQQSIYGRAWTVDVRLDW